MFRFVFPFTLVMLILLFSCKRTQESVPVINLPDYSEETTINLTDLMSDIRIVPLEFIEDHPLSNRSQIHVGNKYIICTSNTALLQYTSNGEFLRILAYQGRGPGELEKLSFPVVNSDETMVYLINDYSDGRIECINLESGEFEEPIPVAFNSAVETFAYFGEDKLLIIPSNWQPTEYYYFIQDLKGNYVSGHKMKRDGLIQLNFRYIRPQQFGEDFLFYHSKFTGDTIFKINQESMSPLLVFKGKGERVDMVEAGYNPFVRSITKDYLFIENWFSEENGGAIEEISYYLMDSNLDVTRISKIVNNITGAVYTGEDLKWFYWDKIISNNSTIAIEISAMEFIESVNINQDNIDDDYRDRVKKISEKLSEYDNQVLLIGQTKRID